jgi:hypothetical protein
MPINIVIGDSANTVEAAVDFVTEHLGEFNSARPKWEVVRQFLAPWSYVFRFHKDTPEELLVEFILRFGGSNAS